MKANNEKLYKKMEQQRKLEKDNGIRKTSQENL